MTFATYAHTAVLQAPEGVSVYASAEYIHHHYDGTPQEPRLRFRISIVTSNPARKCTAWEGNSPQEALASMRLALAPKTDVDTTTEALGTPSEAL